ncbi:MAG TPA: DUF2461 domain-containing protein [Clostridiaceae bacterium]|nr:DUF2461 domain-containing protein [Clostridiaceae bacterium]
MSFEGFTKDALMFLLENRMHNSREWYDSHKDIYKKLVYNPFTELVTELAPVMLEIDSQIITVPSKVISRVRRDTRFTKDKSLYRDNVWIVFLRDKSKMSISPCYWFEINQQGSSYGVGYYSADPASLASMRELILRRDPAFVKALDFYESQDEFVLGGETYKKTRYPDQPENIKSWLNRKNIYFECTQNNHELAFSKKLPKVLKAGFVRLKPVYDFFLKAESYK